MCHFSPLYYYVCIVLHACYILLSFSELSGTLSKVLILEYSSKFQSM